ncbi:tetratricopeptide repeat protein, partial [Embleya sp. NPDC059213]|uniref:tetratricopeptide repeat protein n=1 Tax=Embleya sp. NPDC059213 TaxID=3346771 RepID=UPI0036781A58
MAKRGQRKKAGKRQGGRTGPGGDHVDFRRAHLDRTGQVVGAIGIQHVYSAAAVPQVLDMLPGTESAFTGRETDLNALLAALAPAPRSKDASAGTKAVVVAGLGGVGKTTLAVAAAHAAREKTWYTHTLFLDLRGYDEHPVEPGQALDALLRALGTEPERIPPEVEQRAGWYRATLNASGSRVLVVADNASTAEQVRPLLPGTGPHRLLVTSRHTLTTLTARHLNLGVPDPDTCADLLDRVLRIADPDDGRVGEDPAGAAALANACGFLPLALRITAANLTLEPDRPIAEVTQDLTVAGARLDLLDDGERAVRATFDLSLRRLPHDQVEVFRLLALSPGSDIGLEAATVLTGRPQPRTRVLLALLTQAHLLEYDRSRGERWHMHDLVRDYAGELARSYMATGRNTRRRYTQAIDRLITDHYTPNAEAAALHLDQTAGTVPSGRFADRAWALAWLDTEHGNLVAAALASAAAHPSTPGRASTAARLADALKPYLQSRRHFDDSVTLATLVLDQCTKARDRPNQAGAWTNLGIALQGVRRFKDALAALEQARDTFHILGDTHGEANAWNSLGVTLHEVRRFDEAVTALEHARDTFHTFGDTRGKAGACSNLGVTLREMRRFDEAVAAHEHARDVYHALGDTHREAGVCNNLGVTLREMRRFDEAITAHEHARDTFRILGDIHGEADAWNGLGVVLQGVRRFDEAVAAHEHARDVYHALGDTHREAHACNSLGVVLREMRRFDEAVAAHEHARDVYHLS